jgi:hypothetical protein
LKTIFRSTFDLKKTLADLGIKSTRVTQFSWDKFRAAIALHADQKSELSKVKRFSVFVTGRRWGKTWFVIYRALRTVINYQGKIDPMTPLYVVIAMPTLGMVRRVIWKKLVAVLHGCPIVLNTNKTDLTIDFINKPSILCTSLNDDNGDRIRGLKLLAFFGDEAQAFNAGIIEDAVIPALLDTPGSFLQLTATPKGKQSELYKFFSKSQTDPEWSSHHRKTEDNPTIPNIQQVLETLRRTLDPRTYRQEIEASFEEFAGRIFYAFQRKNHVINIADYFAQKKQDVEFDFYYLGVDWGDRHPAYCVVGVLDRTYFVLETWTNDGVDLLTADQFDKVLQGVCDRYGIYRAIADPAEPSSILALRSYPQEGLQRAIRGYNKLEEGFKILNSLFHQNRIYISDNCTKILHPHRDRQISFVDKIDTYARDVDQQGTITNKIASGQDEHELDSMRYVIATLEYKNFAGLIDNEQ